MKRCIPFLLFFCSLGMTWGQTQFLLSPDTLGIGALYGKSVALEGAVAVVGSGPGLLLPPKGPYIYVFQENGGSWGGPANLVTTDSSDMSYFDLALSTGTSTATIMASHIDDDDGGNRSGACYFFDYELADGTWTQVAKVNGGQYTQNVASLGTSVSIDGDYAIAGAPKYDLSLTPANADDGAAIIFKKDIGTGSWVVDTQLVASDNRPKANFGQGVGISGNYAIVGAHFADSIGMGQSAGAAYIFERTSNGWEEKQKLIPSIRNPLPIGTDNFGWAVDIEGDLAVVGAYSTVLSQTIPTGMAAVFERKSGTWEEVAILIPSDSVASGSFGFDVSVEESGVVGIGAFSSTNGISGYVYKRSGNDWVEQSPIIRNSGLGFAAISIDGDKMLLGSSDSEAVSLYDGICTGGVNIEPIWEQGLFQLYPNPVSRTLYINGIENEAQVRLLSLEGRLISVQQLSSFKNGLNLMDIRAGRYFVQILEGEKSANYQIEVSH